MLTVESQLRAKALEIVKKRMDTYSTLGINTTYEVEVHESMQTIYPINNYDSYQAFKTSSLQPCDSLINKQLCISRVLIIPISILSLIRHI